ncbi:MAG: cytochrome c oxidase accessory protein CcoG, partial [Betaproteobacteria bacterium]|nr:cytochrome c oxidase accessory protein CcoG [Betaproteobacteria bacterium]
ENVYTLRMLNATEQEQPLRLVVHGLPGLQVISETEFSLAPTGARALAVTVRVPPGSSAPGVHPIHFEVQSLGAEPMTVRQDSVFMMPRQ